MDRGYIEALKQEAGDLESIVLNLTCGWLMAQCFLCQ